MRQTQMTVLELAEAIETGLTPYPKCMLVNELGELLLMGDAEAATKLVSLLIDGDEKIRAVAYAWLSKCLPDVYRSQLSEFAKNPFNAEMVTWAAERFGVFPPVETVH